MDRHTKEQRSYNMSCIRSKDTTPELIVRHLVHQMGFRYRLHSSNLPGKPDMVLKRHSKVIFVHGCFWHCHNCKNGQTIPQTNREYWLAKREYNIQRDKTNIQKLRDAGWDICVIWECQTRHTDYVTSCLNKFLQSKESD